MSAKTAKPTSADVAYAYGLALWLWLTALRRTLHNLNDGLEGRP